MNKEEIIERIKISKSNDKIKVIVENTKVYFCMSGDKEEIDLYYYNEKEEGKGRYILATYLRHLLDENYIHVDTVVDAPGTSKEGEELNNYITFYKNHGFKQYDAEPGKTVVLKSTVANILQTLQGPAKYMTYTESILF